MLTELPNGIDESRVYDRDGRLTEIKNQSTSVLEEIDYVYDAVGNPTSLVNLAGTTAYDYDALDRLEEDASIQCVAITFVTPMTMSVTG